MTAILEYFGVDSEAFFEPLELALDGRPLVVGPRFKACRGGGLYRAFFQDDSTTPLALKLWLPGDGADADVEAARQATLASLALARELDHPGVVATLGGGLSGGLCWWLSAWVPGQALADLPGSYFAPECFIRMMADAADALDYVHARNVVHADLSPANLIWNSRVQRPLLLDFGLARRAGGASAASGLFGTPATMAPERARGAPATFRSDQYALATSLARVASATLTIGRRLAPHARAALARATARLPEDRFATLAGFAQALRDPPSEPMGAVAMATA